jgi:galactofuranosylgalactofuranosylrhamnosyl-N-acetylglucosaminyl-diphospho-decaprenol beta-1,5/1,6-galactofuranosyltransferase
LSPPRVTTAARVGTPLQEIRPDAEPAGLRPFLNAFYLSYWRRLTGLRSLTVALEVSGRGTLRVCCRQLDGRRAVLHDVAVDDWPQTLSLEIPMASSAVDGVLEVESDPGVVIHSGAWITSGPPRQDVRLAIVICSFNDPDAVGGNLRRLSGVDAEVIVVDQGGGALEVPAGVRVVRQPNFGGSGGFTRGILEALEADATHVLLVDDDVYLETDLVSRLRGLLAHLKRPVTIGGQMLDLYKPTVLSASHETVDLPRLRLRNPWRDIDLAGPSGPALFAQHQASDYNGWWCCCIPVETLRASLPLPMFVRHDDVEYGLRTGRCGSEVVTMPGIFVWHEPFEPKMKLWYTYYDRRNMMIVGALHGDLPGHRLAALFLRDFWDALRVHRYDICWAVCRAARDFLGGPATVFSDPRPRHEEIVAGVARFGLLTIQSYRARSRSSTGFFGSLRLPEVARPVRTLGREMAAVACQLLLRGARVSSQYRATQGHYSTAEFWRAYLGMNQ